MRNWLHCRHERPPPTFCSTKFEDRMRGLISKRSISKNTKMELTLDSYIKFNVESVPCVQFSSPSKMNSNQAIWIKMQRLQSNLHQNSKTPGVVQKIIQYFFFLNKPILQLECMNSEMFLPLYYSIKRMGNVYLPQCYAMLSSSIFLFWYSVYKVLLSTPGILI